MQLSRQLASARPEDASINVLHQHCIMLVQTWRHLRDSRAALLPGLLDAIFSR